MFLEYFPGSIPFNQAQVAIVRATELAEIYWIPFIVTSGTDGRWHVEPYQGEIEGEPKLYRSWSGATKHIIQPPQEPEEDDMAYDDTVEVVVTVVATTPNAVLVETEDYEGETVEVWIPRGQIKSGHEDLEKDDEVSLEITEWIARKKDLLVDEDED